MSVKEEYINLVSDLIVDASKQIGNVDLGFIIGSLIYDNVTDFNDIDVLFILDKNKQMYKDPIRVVKDLLKTDKYKVLRKPVDVNIMYSQYISRNTDFHLIMYLGYKLVVYNEDSEAYKIYDFIKNYIGDKKDLIQPVQVYTKKKSGKNKMVLVYKEVIANAT